ncbi:MAG: hypothetical protein VB141_13180, partial [Burkholderia gladioli]
CFIISAPDHVSCFDSASPNLFSHSLGAAVNSIAGLLSDSLTIGGTQDHGETRDTSKGDGQPDDPNPAPEHDDAPSGEDGTQSTNPDDGQANDGTAKPDNPEGHDDATEIPDDAEVTVSVGGDKTETLTFAELKSGYLRQSDYTRKTAALAAERQTVQQEQAQAREDRANYQQGVEQVSMLLKQLTPTEPTQEQWDALHAQDPQEWTRQREYWRSWKEQQAALANEQAQLAQRQQTDFAKTLQERFTDEARKLQDAIPEWRDSKLAKAEKDAIREYAYLMGFTPEDVNMTVDHRVFVMARKAMLYDKLMTTKATLKPGAPPQTTKVVRPGTQGTKPVARTAVAEARQRLVKTGNVRDAAALLEKLI